MATLTVWRFDAPDTAQDAMSRLDELQKKGILRVGDAATISWPDDREAPRIRQAINTTGAGALGGAFWGLLAGFIFFVPLLGAAVGAAAGAISGALTDIGIDDRFIKDMREEVTRGTSALVLLADSSAPDKVHDELRDLSPRLITSNLSHDQESRLRELFND